jgi:hypothetical protein
MISSGSRMLGSAEDVAVIVVIISSRPWASNGAVIVIWMGALKLFPKVTSGGQISTEPLMLDPSSSSVSV